MFCVLSELGQLDQLYYEKIKSAYADSTMANFRYQAMEYVNFCLNHGCQIFPPVPMNIARYITSCTLKVAAYGTIQNKLSAIRKLYHLCGHNVDTSDPIIDLLLRACKRDMSSVSKPKAPIEPGHIILISQMMDQSDIHHTLFYTALLIQFFGCLRKSNLLPPSVKGFSVVKQLTRGDIHIVQDGIIISLPWTKTLQNSDDVMTIAIAQVPNSIIDPVSQYKNFILRFLLPPRMPAFSLSAGDKLYVFTQNNYIDYLKHFLERLGLPSSAYGSHSVRRGGTTALFQSGVSQKLIKAHGGWRSDCYERYISVGQSDKLVPTTKMLNFINSKYGNYK